MPERVSFSTKILRLTRAIGLFLAHVAAAAVIVVALWALTKEFAYFGVLNLFGICPLNYVFDAGDLALIVVLIYFAVREMINELKG